MKVLMMKAKKIFRDKKLKLRKKMINMSGVHLLKEINLIITHKRDNKNKRLEDNIFPSKINLNPRDTEDSNSLNLIWENDN